MPTKRPWLIERIVENIRRQNYRNKEVLIIAQDYSDQEIDQLREALELIQPKLVELKVIRNDSNDSLGIRLNSALKEASGDYWAKMDDDDFYFENYLSDAIMHIVLNRCDIVGKRALFFYFEELNYLAFLREGDWYRFVSHVSGSTLVVNRKTCNLNFHDISEGEDTEYLKDAVRAGMRIYASDPFNHVVVRSKSSHQHTWQVKADKLAEGCLFMNPGTDMSSARV